MWFLFGALLAAGGLAMSARAQSNVVYAVEYNQSTNRFGTIDLLSGNFTKISSFGSMLINDIAYCPTNGTLYGISNTTALVTFNKTNGAITTDRQPERERHRVTGLPAQRWSVVRSHVEQTVHNQSRQRDRHFGRKLWQPHQPWHHRAEHPLCAGRQPLRQQHEHEHRYLSDQHHERRRDVDGRSRRLPLPDASERQFEHVRGLHQFGICPPTRPPSWRPST